MPGTIIPCRAFVLLVDPLFIVVPFFIRLFRIAEFVDILSFHKYTGVLIRHFMDIIRIKLSRCHQGRRDLEFLKIIRLSAVGIAVLDIINRRNDVLKIHCIVLIREVSGGEYLFICCNFAVLQIGLVNIVLFPGKNRDGICKVLLLDVCKPILLQHPGEKVL